MTAPRSDAQPAARATGTALTMLEYWLFLLGALAIATEQHRDAPWFYAPLCAGAVLGVLAGQLLARAWLRLWLVAFCGLFLAASSAWVVAIVTALLDPQHNAAVGTYLLALAPALLSGYLAFGERTALLAFWFPTALGVGAVVGRDGDLDGVVAWAVLGALLLALLAFLRAREARRVALWKRCAPVALARPSAPRVLRRDPTRAAARAASAATVGAVVVAVAGVFAPRLWRPRPGPASAASAPRAADGARCCGPDDEHLVDYLPLPETHLPGSRACVPCPAPATAATESVGQAGTSNAGVEGSGSGTYDTEGSSLASSGSGATAASGTVAAAASGGHDTWYGTPDPAPRSASAPGARHDAHSAGHAAGRPHAGHSAAATRGSSSATTRQARSAARTPSPRAPAAPHVAPAPAPAPAPREAAAPAPAPEAPPPPLPAVPPASAPPAAQPAAPAAPDAHPEPAAPSTPRVDYAALGWALAALLAVLALCIAAQIAARVLRRHVTVRHLREPLFSETLDQRVSNLWQLALIGLRDAGVETPHDEQPGALATRVGDPELRTCAEVLERARHGVRVDEHDLAAMTRAAAAVYASARQRAGLAARAVGWLRQPLA